MQRSSASSGEVIEYSPLKSGNQDLPLEPSHHAGRATKDWPCEPQTLQQARIAWPLRLGPHIALLLIPVGSVVLGIAVFCTHGTGKSVSGNSIMQAMAITATLWPILFAAVLGPMLKAAALHQAERGVKIGTLELLFTSQTLVNTLRGCFTLRFISVWPIILVAMWSLSPIGGQGALRALSLRENITSHEYAMVTYPTTNLSVAFARVPAPYKGASLINQMRAPIGAAFSTQDVTLLHSENTSQAFQSAVERLGGMQEALKITQRDLWRNVRIPFLHMLEGYHPQFSEWLSVPGGTIPGYSSLIGVPIRGYPSMKSGNISFVIQTSYQVLDCKAWLNGTNWRIKNNGSLLAPTSEYTQGLETDIPGIHLAIMNDTTRMYFPGQSVTNDSWPMSRMKLVFSTALNLTICDISTEYIEAGIQCARVSQQGDVACHATKIRRVTLAPEFKKFENLTALDIGGNRDVVAYIPDTLPSNHPFESSFLERWLRDPATSFDQPYYQDQTWYRDVPMNVFSNRLSMVLNTFLQATLNTSCIFGSDCTSLEGRDETWSNTTGTWTEFTAPVYQLHKVWFLLYIISAAVLTVSALVNILLRIWTHSPDFLGSVSALTRDSAFIQTLTPASTLDGSDRTRLLRDTWVMIQDVQPDDKVGRIALSDVGEAVALRKDRQYL